METHSVKKKGNLYERKFAKLLSYWLFKDEHVLKRHYTSGADRSVYRGDVIPLKTLPDNMIFPFYIEIKSGYKSNTPTFWSYDKIVEWFTKCLRDSQNTVQKIILLICQFKNKHPLVVSNIYLEDIIHMCIPITFDSNLIYAYIYMWKKFIEFDPRSILSILNQNEGVEK